MKTTLKLLCVFTFVIIAFFIIQKNNDSSPTTKIPKTFHYVWLGSKELPDAVKKSIQTWQKHQPDFKIKRWDETNCDLTANHFIRTNYESKRFNFASDWCRILALEEGGVYFDTDMILNQPIAPLLDAPLILSMQREDDLSASVMAVIPNHPYVKKIKEKYNQLSNTEIYSPVVWNETFLEYFKEEKINPQKKENIYHVYHANILMHNFKGGENVAEHIYANTNTNIQKSKWFDIFRKQFLDKYAYYISNKNYYLIKKNRFNGYLIDAQTFNFIHNVKYLFFNNYLYIHYPEMNLFSCDKTICEKF